MQSDIPVTLLGEQRLPKDHPRVEAVGVIDELNVFVGAVRTGLSTDGTVPPAVRETLDGELRGIQERLVDMGVGVGEGRGLAVPGPKQVQALDESLARMEEGLTHPARPILPGGVPTTARLHMCRTICDRAERALVRLARVEDISADSLRYLERLSIWFMAAARVVAGQTGKEWIYG